MFPELTRKPHPTHEQSRYSFSSVHNVELGNLMKDEEEEIDEMLGYINLPPSFVVWFWYFDHLSNIWIKAST